MKKILFLSFLCLVACKENRDTSKKISASFELVKTDSLILPNPSDGHFMSWNTQLINYNDKKVLTRLRYSGERGIDYFDLKNKSYIRSDIFEKQGDQGLGEVSNYYFISEDSLAIYNQRQLILTDKNLKIRNIYNYMDDYDKLWYILQDSNVGQVVFKNNKLYFGKVDFEYQNTNAFYSSKISTELDLETGDFVEHKAMTFPKSYFDKCWGNYTTIIYKDYNKETQKFVYSFPTNHKLFVFDPYKDEIVEKPSVKSDFLSEDFESMDCNYYDNYNREREYYLKTGKYLKILHDPYRNVYYRFVELPMKDEDAVFYTGRADALYSTEIAIMILDKDFNIMGETKLPKHQYINWDFFILEDGLYISANNPNHPFYKEDELNYHKFEVKKKK